MSWVGRWSSAIAVRRQQSLVVDVFVAQVDHAPDAVLARQRSSAARKAAAAPRGAR
jgi:hypothetical protein